MEFVLRDGCRGEWFSRTPYNPLDTHNPTSILVVTVIIVEELVGTSCGYGGGSCDGVGSQAYSQNHAAISSY